MIINENIAKEWLKGLLKIDSVQSEAKENMPFGEGNRKALDYSLGLLESLGFKTKDLEGYCGYGDIGEGEMFGVLCHLDVVPISGEWKYPPFSATEENGKIFARGALDDKGPFIACLYAVAKLLSEGRKPTKKIRFILGCNEESGWACMDRYVKTEKLPDIGISPDADFPIINCEKGVVYHTLSHKLPDRVEYLKGGERGNMVADFAEAKVKSSEKLLEVLKVTDCEYEEDNGYVIIKTKGKSCHGSAPQEGENAIYKMFAILAQEHEIFQKMLKFVDFEGTEIGLNISDEVSGKHTHNMGKCETLFHVETYQLDVRFPISYKKEDITKLLKEKLDFLEVERGAFHDPLYVAEDDPLVVTLLNAYNKVMGTDEKPITIGGGTYARVLPKGVAFGMMFPKTECQIHCVDEYVLWEDFINASKIYCEAIKNLCF